jgi:hypothetical protein
VWVRATCRVPTSSWLSARVVSLAKWLLQASFVGLRVTLPNKPLQPTSGGARAGRFARTVKADSRLSGGPLDSASDYLARSIG